LQEISELEMRLLTTVADCISEHGYQPSYRELADAWGWSSPGYVLQLACSLEKKGVLKRRGSRALEFDWRDWISEGWRYAKSRGSNRKAVAHVR
jgi:SOS-response transcriptional repressor LexA